MESLFETWKTKIPNYAESFESALFQTLSKKGGGSEQSKIDWGKHFSNNYELYMYAFFLGLYRNERSPIEESKTNFRHAIQHWGSKSNLLNRKDFTMLQDFMFIACIARTDIDLIALDKGEIKEKEVVRVLVVTMEAYTNAGLTLIKEKAEDSPNFFLQPTAFLDFIINE